MLRVGSSGKIRACGKGPDNTVRNNCQTQKGASSLFPNFPNFCRHHYRHQHVMVNQQLPGSLFELPPKLSMSFWPEAAFHFALKGRGRWQREGRWVAGWPLKCSRHHFPLQIRQVRLPLHFHSCLRQFQEMNRRRQFCPSCSRRNFCSRAAADKTWVQLQRPLCKQRPPDATETVSRSLFLSLDKVERGKRTKLNKIPKLRHHSLARKVVTKAECRARSKERKK